MNRMLTGQLANRLTAFKRLERYSGLAGRYVSPQILAHWPTLPQAT